jgi:hypothetical protein
VTHSWRLNERNYGALTGLSKTQAGAQLGEEMLLKYRRGYDVEPMPMTEEHPCWTGNDRKYRELGPLMPRGESLKQCMERILPYWENNIVPSVRAGRVVLVAAHNNVIRCLCKHIDNIHVDNLRDIEIPTVDLPVAGTTDVVPLLLLMPIGVLRLLCQRFLSHRHQGVPLMYTLDRRTLAPLGEPDKCGFRGRFLEDEHGDLEPLVVLAKEELVIEEVAYEGGWIRWPNPTMTLEYFDQAFPTHCISLPHYYFGYVLDSSSFRRFSDPLLVYLHSLSLSLS